MPVIETLSDFDVPEQLLELVDRHKQHLIELVTKLRTVGIDEIAIEETVDQLIANYRVQLLEAAKALRAAS